MHTMKRLGQSQPPCHAFTVDVEDWFHDGGRNGREVEERVEENTEQLLDLCAAAGARGTFFVLGEVAERFPGLIRRIAAAGHEIASHGYQHRKVRETLWREFRADVERSVRLLEDITGHAVHGFRAPYFSIPAQVRWPVQVLGELGLRYDSSVLPIDRPPGLELITPRTPHRHYNGLWEVPIAILRVGPFWHLPIASGAGLRLLPRRLLHRSVRRFEREVGAGVFYVHPWELDPRSPTGPGRGRWLLRLGRTRLAPALAALLSARRFAPIVEVFPDVLR